MGISRKSREKPHQQDGPVELSLWKVQVYSLKPTIPATRARARAEETRDAARSGRSGTAGREGRAPPAPLSGPTWGLSHRPLPRPRPGIRAPPSCLTGGKRPLPATYRRQAAAGLTHRPTHPAAARPSGGDKSRACPQPQLSGSPLRRGRAARRPRPAGRQAPPRARRPVAAGREGREGGKEGDARCHFPSSPRAAPYPPPPAPGGGGAPSPGAALRAPRRQQAGQGTAQQGRAGQGRAAARLRAPLPSPGMAGRWGTPHRPGSARLGSAPPRGSAPSRPLSSPMVQSDMSKSPPSPAQEVQMELLDNPLSAAAAAQVPRGAAGLGRRRGACGGRRGRAGLGSARLRGGLRSRAAGGRRGAAGLPGLPVLQLRLPAARKVWRLSRGAWSPRPRPPPPPPQNAAPLTRTMDGTPRATEAPSVKRTVELPGGRMWKQPLPFRSSSARVSLAGGACVPCSANLLFLYLTRTARCRNHPPPPHRLRSRLCWWAKAAGAGCGAGILGRPKVLSALQASGARLRCGRWLHGHLWNFNNSVRAGCGQGSGVRRGGVFAGLVKTLCFGRWFLVNVWVLHNIFEFAGVGYEDLRCYF